MIESRCGILCNECPEREKMGCPGCTCMEKPFWGDSCPVKSCCEGRNSDHCGLCNDFSCELLNSFAFDKEHGDNGRRIKQCETWRKEKL